MPCRMAPPLSGQVPLLVFAQYQVPACLTALVVVHYNCLLIVCLLYPFPDSVTSRQSLRLSHYISYEQIP